MNNECADKLDYFFFQVCKTFFSRVLKSVWRYAKMGIFNRDEDLARKNGISVFVLSLCYKSSFIPVKFSTTRSEYSLIFLFKLV